MKKFAFTMAEILISLTIVGVIAAVTLPALQGNINEKTWATQKKALYSRMTQAISMMPAVNGYGFDPDNMNNVKTKATLAFISEFSKVLKINNICDSDHLADCGIRTESNKLKVSDAKGIQTNIDVTNLLKYLQSNNVTIPANAGENYSGSDKIALDIKNSALETVNGESMLVLYNPYCGSNTNDTNTENSNDILNKVCATFIYDLNGANGPNTFGKDIGVVSVLYSTDSVVVAPQPAAVTISGTKNFSDAVSSCRAKDEDTRVPNLEEAISMRYNTKLFNTSASSDTTKYWTNTTIDTETAWIYTGSSYKAYKKTDTAAVQCIKR